MYAEMLWVFAWEFACVCVCGVDRRAVGFGEGALQTQGLTPSCGPLSNNSHTPSEHEGTPLYSQTHIHTCKHTHGCKCMHTIRTCSPLTLNFKWIQLNLCKGQPECGRAGYPFLFVSMKTSLCVTPVRPHCN